MPKPHKPGNWYIRDVTKTQNGMINGMIHGMKVSSLVDLLRTATHEGRLL